MDDKSFPKRKHTRLRDFDYNNEGVYFVTLCTQDKRKILSKIITPVNNVGNGVPDVPTDEYSYLNATVKLLPKGIIAEKILNQIDSFYEDISVIKYIIMPNHIHLLLWAKPNEALKSEANGTSRTPFPTIKQNSRVSSFISTLKRFCNKEYGYNIWQKSFYDHVIRNQQDYEKHIDYICNNPIRWEFDKLYVDE